MSLFMLPFFKKLPVMWKVKKASCLTDHIEPKLNMHSELLILSFLAASHMIPNTESYCHIIYSFPRDKLIGYGNTSN